MTYRFKPHAAWLAGWIVASLLGASLLARAELGQLREAFETDARIAHRLLSQRVVQHDAVLSTLTLLHAAAEQGPEQRLPSIYPQILSVQRSNSEPRWSDARLQAAEAESRREGRAALAGVDFQTGHYQLVVGADPASYALLVDIQSMVPWAEWPAAPASSPTRVTLEHAGQSFALQNGALQADRAASWRFSFHKHLAAPSQPFDVVAIRQVGWGELPWTLMLGWSLLVALALLAARAWLRQRIARRRAEDLLRLGQVARLNTMGELAAGMAHELNQPLTAMLANTQAANRVLNEEPPDLQTARLAIGQAVEQARRASAVVSRLRRTVEPSGGTALAQPIDLAELARKALHLLEPELRRRAVECSIELQGPQLQVQGEPVALEQIVHNLLMNALQALEQVPVGQRKLVLALKASGGFGELVLSDTGPGIAPEALPHLFAPFFTTREGGLGLGLSLSESLASSMGATLSAGNRAGRGAEFCLRLPLATPA